MTEKDPLEGLFKAVVINPTVLVFMWSAERGVLCCLTGLPPSMENPNTQAVRGCISETSFNRDFFWLWIFRGVTLLFCIIVADGQKADFSCFPFWEGWGSVCGFERPVSVGA